MRIHRGALSSRQRNRNTTPWTMRAPMGIALALLLSVGGLTAVATPSGADTAPRAGVGGGPAPVAVRRQRRSRGLHGDGDLSCPEPVRHRGLVLRQSQ